MGRGEFSDAFDCWTRHIGLGLVRSLASTDTCTYVSFPLCGLFIILERHTTPTTHETHQPPRSLSFAIRVETNAPSHSVRHNVMHDENKERTKKKRSMCTSLGDLEAEGPGRLVCANSAYGMGDAKKRKRRAHVGCWVCVYQMEKP